MKLSKKIISIFIFFLSLSYLNAGLVDGISVVIDNEPITLYEVYKYSQRFKISKKEALDILIRQKLEDSQIKKFGIGVSSFELEKYIENIAKKNNLSVFKFFEMLKSRGIDEEEYKKDIKTKIKRDKLYKKIILSKTSKIDEEELKSYYKKNRNQFAVAKEFKAVVYKSKNRDSLEKIKSNPMFKPMDVTIEEKLFKAGEMDKNLESLLNSIKPREFTSIFKMKDGFTMFYLREKIDVKTIPFANVKNYIYSLLSSKKEKSIINEYFDKLKADASIKILRKP